MFVARRKIDGAYLSGRYGVNTDLQKARTFNRVCDAKNSAFRYSDYDILEVHLVLGPDPSKPVGPVKTTKEKKKPEFVDISAVYDLGNIGSNFDVQPDSDKF